MIIVAIDPGKNGAMTRLDTEANECVVVSIPYDKDGLLIKHKMDLFLIGANVVGIEQQHSFHGQGVKSMFNQGMNYGLILGFINALDLPIMLIPANKWKKKLGLTGTNKDNSISYARGLFPNLELKRSAKCRIESNDMGDAVCLAHYVQLMYSGG